jgi:hypothetical protein
MFNAAASGGSWQVAPTVALPSLRIRRLGPRVLKKLEFDK